MGAKTEVSEATPLFPPTPEDLYFSGSDYAWILSRYLDVSMALRSPCLSQSRPTGEPASDPRVRQSHDGKTSEFSSNFLATQVPGWQIQIKSSAISLLERLSTLRPVDLVSDFVRPWCLEAALTLASIDVRHGPHLGRLIARLSESDAAPLDTDLKGQAREANRELDRFFQSRSAPNLKSLLLGVSQTLPTFLASAWVTLLEHPAALRSLQEHPTMIVKGIQELLRYAGPVHTVFRQADSDVEIAGKVIRRDDRLILRISSANRDPLQFSDPDRLDFTREVAGHLALSAGSHHCPGASIVRTLTAIATQVLIERYFSPELAGPVVWSFGTMLIWPSSIPVLLGDTFC